MDKVLLLVILFILTHISLPRSNYLFRTLQYYFEGAKNHIENYKVIFKKNSILSVREKEDLVEIIDFVSLNLRALNVRSTNVYF